MLTPAGLLDLYDNQLRGVTGLTHCRLDTDGPLTRVTGGHRGFVTGPRDLGLSADEVDRLIAGTIAHFQQVGQSFEWKTRSHDLPVDLPEKLLAMGFVPEEPETVMIGQADRIPEPSPLPGGITVRRTVDPRDLAGIAQLHSRVWGADFSWLATDLQDRIAHDPEGLVIFVAEDGGRVVAAAWMVPEGVDFVGLWGGSTLANYRRRGIYRNLVAQRAAQARAWGRRYLQVDASIKSAPILAKLGLDPVTTTTPYVWHLPGTA